MPGYLRRRTCRTQIRTAQGKSAIRPKSYGLRSEVRKRIVPELPAPSPYSFASFKVTPCDSSTFYGDGSVTWIRPALCVTDANAFGAISINSIPVFRSRSPGKDEWLTPTDLIYDKTAGVIRRKESKLAGITDSLQTIAMRNLLRIGIKRITLA